MSTTGQTFAPQQQSQPRSLPEGVQSAARSTEEAVEKVQKRTGRFMPAKWSASKAIIGMIIALVLFGIGVLSGAVFPWWITVILTLALAFGTFVGAAWIDSTLRCESLEFRTMAAANE